MPDTDDATVGVYVRPAREEDASAIAPLLRELGSADDEETLAARYLRLLVNPVHGCFLAETTGDGTMRTVCGFAHAERRLVLAVGERVELIALVVDARHRRAGAGRALVAAVEAWALRCGIADTVVRSSVDRDASHPFYRSLGYRLHKTQHVYTRTLTSRTLTP